YMYRLHRHVIINCIPNPTLFRSALLDKDRDRTLSEYDAGQRSRAHAAVRRADINMFLGSDRLPPGMRWAALRTVSLPWLQPRFADRKSTRLNSSHVKNSYAVFCL